MLNKVLIAFKVLRSVYIPKLLDRTKMDYILDSIKSATLF